MNNNEPKIYLLSYFLDASNISDTKLVAELEVGFDNRYIYKSNIFLALLAIENEA